MKNYKVKVFTLAVICMLFVSISVVLADDKSDVIVSLQIDNPLMEVNGTELEIDAGRGTKPVVINGRTLVPVRAIIESLGGCVEWDELSGSVLLTVDGDVIRLTVDSNTAYLNNNIHILDVAPTVINDRTMLPIRFVAEGFNFGVAWEDDTRTVSIIRNSFDDEEYNLLMSILPEYSGTPYTHINGNKPFFEEYEIINGSFEYYGNLDEFGRCDVCFASIAKDIMPTEGRKSISSVTPTGWINASYDNIDGGYLYNRCHLIGFQLTGENANERNLITGTRYLNVEGMLPFENMIADYIDQTGHRVIYRSTPVFSGSNLLADGVLIEAYSVEDAGQGISFCVYCYNVQPQISIDYSTGASSSVYSPTVSDAQSAISGTDVTSVYRTPTGRKYHFDVSCGGKNSFAVLLTEALNAGLEPCAKCVE